jgi:ParB family chromosome partitioning protein
MAKLKPNLAEINDFAPAKMLQNYVTPDVKTVETSALTPHPDNKKFFRKESPEYFERLREDIQKRGIVVPLIAKKNGVLLAGHNRLETAKELGLKYVPVQYVHRDLSEEQEREFLIKDNLLRRQFNSDEWIEIYRRLYPTFEEEIIQERLKGRAKSGSKTLSAKSIADDTGQKVSAVQKQLQKFRRENVRVEENKSTRNHSSLPQTKKGGTIPPFSKTSVSSAKGQVSSASVLKNSRKECVAFLKDCIKKVEMIDDVKQLQQVQKKVALLVKFLE